jgi:hypothetical protein
MNYYPNTTHWEIGNIVIHDADAKRADMLMKVIGFSRDGMVKLCYVKNTPFHNNKTIYLNRMCVLHDPKRFGIDVEEVK